MKYLCAARKIRRFSENAAEWAQKQTASEWSEAACFPKHSKTVLKTGRSHFDIADMDIFRIVQQKSCNPGNVSGF